MGSPWRDKISLAILELQEKGEIQMLYDKWWKSPKDHCVADKTRQSNKANALGVNNIGGVFVVLLCGLAFAVLIAILEFCHKSRQQHGQFAFIDNVCLKDGLQTRTNYLDIDSSVMSHLSEMKPDDMYAQRQSLFTDMTDELCLAIKCQGSRQRAVFRSQCSNCRRVRQPSATERNEGAPVNDPMKVHVGGQSSGGNMMEMSLSLPSSSKTFSYNVRDDPVNSFEMTKYSPR